MNKTKQRLCEIFKMDENSILSSPVYLNIDKKKYIIYPWDINYDKTNNSHRLIKNTSVTHFEFKRGYTTLVLGYSEDYHIFGIYNAKSFKGELPVIKSFYFKNINSFDGCKMDYRNENGRHVWYVIPSLLKPFLSTNTWSLVDAPYIRSSTRKDLGSGKTGENFTGEKRKSTARSRHFQFNLKKVYNHKCALTGKKQKDLEAAHIADVASKIGNDSVNNGLLMNKKDHKHFDCGRLVILPDYTYYYNLENSRTIDLSKARKSLILPENTEHHPEPKFFIEKLSYLGFDIPKEIKV